MQPIYNLQHRNKAVVLLKFFAALLITYSHFGILFPKYGWLVTGGALGDGFFFFCSGFTLFLGRDGGFANWYKRRINRIYPSVFSWIFLSFVLFGWVWSVSDVFTLPRYWFLPCIMVYYVIFYIIRKFFINYINIVATIAVAIVVVSSFFILDMSASVMYAQLSFMRVYYFLFMLLGATVALDINRSHDSVDETHQDTSLRTAGGAFVLSLVVYYLCMGAYKFSPFLCKFQLLSLIPLMSAIYFFFKLCSCPSMIKVFDHPLVGNIVYAISSLTLEIYLVHKALITDRFNGIFPFNIILTYIAVFALAYVLKIFSNLFSQIFGSENIDIRKLFAL